MEQIRKPLTLVQLFAGLAVVITCLVMMISWHFGILGLTRGLSNSVSMSYLSAFFLFVAGILLLIQLTNLKNFGYFLAIFFNFKLLILFLERETGVHIGFREFLTDFSPYSQQNLAVTDFPDTLEFLAAGIASVFLFVANRYLSIICAAIGSFIIGIGIFTLTAHLLDFSEQQIWQIFSQISAPTALVFVFLGTGLIFATWNRQTKGKIRFPNWLLVIIIIFTLTISLDIYFAVSTQQQIAFNFALEARAAAVENIFLEKINKKFAALAEIAKQSVSYSPEAQQSWKKEAESLMSIFSGIRAIYLFDDNLRLKMQIALDNHAPILHDFSKIPRTKNSKTISEVFQLENGKKRICLYLTLYDEDTFKGYLIGEIDLERFFKDILSKEIEDGFEIAVLEGEKKIFATRDWENISPFAEKKINFNGTNWVIRGYPSKHIANQLNSVLPQIYLSIGILISILIGLFIYYLKQSKIALRRNLIINRRMKREIKRRQALEEDLVQTRDKALQSSRLKSAFLANMSHEIRTPINGIIGATELLMQAGLNKEQLEYARIVENSSEVLLKTVNKILDLTKIEENKMEIENVEFCLSDLSKKIADLFKLVAERKSLDFEIRFDKCENQLVGDLDKIEQILINLTGNAIKFTEKGKVIVEAEVLQESGSALEVIFRVKDTGIGIAPESREILFEPFIQADISTTRKYGGTGLGLTICRKLVELMGGKIGVESELGKGSTFWFQINLQRIDAVISSASAEKSDTGEIQKANSFILPENAPRILLVEDNPTNQLVTRRIIEKLGYRIEVAENGQKALEKVKQSSYDIILMDCQMPVMDGYAATQEIRRFEKTIDRYTPIIAITAHAMSDDSEKCFAAGMNGYLTKPIGQDKLSRIFQVWLKDNLKKDRRNSSESVSTLINSTQDEEIIKRLNVLADECGIEAIPEIVRQFLDDMLKKVIQLERLLRQPDKYDDLAQEAHTLKGACLNIGATTIAGICLSLEEAAKKKDFESAFAHGEKLAQHFEELHEKLELALCRSTLHQP